MKLALPILIGVFSEAGGGYTFYCAQGVSYFSSDPQACMNCHVMRDQFDRWEKPAITITLIATTFTCRTISLRNG